MARKKKEQPLQLKSFTFWESYADATRDLSPRAQGEVYRAIVEFTLYGHDLEEALSAPARVVYKLLKTHLKTSRNRAKSGVAGNNSRWGDKNAIANASQGDSKNNARLSSSSRLSSRSNQTQTVGEALAGATPPVCADCNRTAYRNQQMGAWVCPVCNRRLA